FFFSSRRRHTRFSRDWSSDVCSSDLNDLKFNNGGIYSVYEWENEHELKLWNFVSNIYKKQEVLSVTDETSLFRTETTTRTIQLVPEYKKVNYFLKISDETQTVNTSKIIGRIQKIPQVATAYTIDVDQLTSKGNLIF